MIHLVYWLLYGACSSWQKNKTKTKLAPPPTLPFRFWKQSKKKQAGTQLFQGQKKKKNNTWCFNFFCHMALVVELHAHTHTHTHTWHSHRHTHTHCKPAHEEKSLLGQECQWHMKAPSCVCNFGFGTHFTSPWILWHPPRG